MYWETYYDCCAPKQILQHKVCAENCFSKQSPMLSQTSFHYFLHTFQVHTSTCNGTIYSQYCTGKTVSAQPATYRKKTNKKCCQPNQIWYLEKTSTCSCVVSHSTVLKQKPFLLAQPRWHWRNHHIAQQNKVFCLFEEDTELFCDVNV